jgi:hypothetical protein
MNKETFIELEDLLDQLHATVCNVALEHIAYALTVKLEDPEKRMESLESIDSSIEEMKSFSDALKRIRVNLEMYKSEDNYNYFQIGENDNKVLKDHLHSLAAFMVDGDETVENIKTLETIIKALP